MTQISGYVYNPSTNGVVVGFVLPTGPQGVQGVAGYQGSDGAQGTQGIQGNTGTQGTDGYQGSDGAQGTQGIQGTTGSGTQGTQGIQGNTGTQGTDGYQGSDGAQGTQGIQGTTGSGTQGAQGIQGTTGSGTQGAQGIQGTTGSGTQGTTGSQGIQGRQGLAYSDASLVLYVLKAGDTLGGNYTMNASNFIVNGRVGIGTSNPSYGLNIVVPQGGGGSLKINNNDSYEVYFSGDTQSSNIFSEADLYIGTTTAKYIYIGTNGVNSQLNVVSGKIGINKSSPGYNLDVSGNVFFDGSLNMNSQKIVNLGIPISSSDAVNKYYVDSSLNQVIDINTLTFQKASAPLNSSSNGTYGSMAYDASYLYVCTSTNIWVRTLLTSW
jgi:hypothetical protein